MGGLYWNFKFCSEICVLKFQNCAHLHFGMGTPELGWLPSPCVEWQDAWIRSIRMPNEPFLVVLLAKLEFLQFWKFQNNTVRSCNKWRSWKSCCAISYYVRQTLSSELSETVENVEIEQILVENGQIEFGRISWILSFLRFLRIPSLSQQIQDQKRHTTRFFLFFSRKSSELKLIVLHDYWSHDRVF